MITENLSTLKIHKLSQAQYERELEAGRIDESALYLTPDEDIDLSIYATTSDVDTLRALVGDTSVASQISTAIKDKVDDDNVATLDAKNAIFLTKVDAFVASGYDLNSVTTLGTYTCTAPATVKTFKNCPTTEPFIMYVGHPAPSATKYISQEVYELIGGTRSYRYTYDGGTTWTKWTRTFDNSDHDSAYLADVRQKLCRIGTNPVSYDNDLPSSWYALGTGYAYINKGKLPGQPTTYGIVENIVFGDLIRQIWYAQDSTGIIYERAGRYFPADEDTAEVNKWYRTWRSLDISDKNTSSDLGKEWHIKSCQNFVDEMNNVASSIGMKNTVFKTPSGLCRPLFGKSDAESAADKKYNSWITAYDLLLLLIAARHTPLVLEAMGKSEHIFRVSGKRPDENNEFTKILENEERYAAHIALNPTLAEEYNYKVIAAKGGSLDLGWGENGSDGILNMGYIIEHSDGKQYAVAILGLKNFEKLTLDKNLLSIFLSFQFFNQFTKTSI